MSLPSPVSELQRRDFQALDLAFLGSLLPGIIHNWATPLSGVIGATQLLERRATTINDLLTHHESLNVAEREELQLQLSRNRTNVEILSRNAQHLADLLQVLVYRITRSNGTARDCFPLHELVQHELRFLEANLQFKHKVRKTITFDPVIPKVEFAYGYVAAVIEEFVTTAIAGHDFKAGAIEMDFATGTEGGSAQISIAARYIPAQTEDRMPDALAFHLPRLTDDGWAIDRTTEPSRTTFCLRRAARSPA